MIEYRHTEDGLTLRVVSAEEAAREMAWIVAKACPWCDSTAAPYLVERQEDDEQGLALICPACEEDRGWASSGFFSDPSTGGGAR